MRGTCLEEPPADEAVAGGQSEGAVGPAFLHRRQARLHGGKHFLHRLIEVLEVGDPLGEHLDVVAFNEYVGWYNGLPDRCKEKSFEVRFDKPLIVSEFGGGALAGLHGDKTTRWTEEYQEWMFRESLPMLEKIPQLRGTTPWVLADFRSPLRMLPNIQDGWNRKGLVSERGERKKAFFVMKRWYGNLAGRAARSE